jgi:hypothetical protein
MGVRPDGDRQLLRAELTVNGELLCELVRAHYDNDKERFDVLLMQIIESQRLTGSTAVAGRLADIAAKAHGWS